MECSTALQGHESADEQENLSDQVFLIDTKSMNMEKLFFLIKGLFLHKFQPICLLHIVFIKCNTSVISNGF